MRRANEINFVTLEKDRMKRPRILLADSSTLLMEAITKLLEPEFVVVSMVADGRELLRTALVVKPDIAVLDVSIPFLSGLKAGRSLRANLPAIKLVYLTMDQDGDVVDQAFRLGASAYVVKSCTTSDLLTAIRGAWLRPSYLSPFVTGRNIVTRTFVRGRADKASPLRLTPRQREVLKLLATGRSMKEVAFALQIKPRTVAYHKYRIMDDFNLGSTAALVRFALREQVA
jgi:DNA-binding NarL/FixJ family response regulator